MTSVDFLNVDLEIESRSSLAPLIAEFGERIIVLYSNSKPNKQFLSLESTDSGLDWNPDKTIARLCNLLEKLSPQALKIWNKARRKTFDIGVDLNPKTASSQFHLANQSLRRIAALGATLTITCYARTALTTKKRRPPPVVSARSR